MKNFILFQPGWWVLHAVAVVFMFWLGARVNFF